MKQKRRTKSWPMSEIWSRKFYGPRILGKQKQNY